MKVANMTVGPPGLNAVSWVIEGVTHHICVGVVQLPEHLQEEPTFLIHMYTGLLPYFLPLNIFKQKKNKQPQAPLTDSLHLHCESHCHEALCWKNPPP